MTDISHILVDMDGVLCDFFGAALRLFNLDIANYPPNEWEIANVAGISVEEFWRTIEGTPDFWLNIEPLPHFQDMLEMLNATNVPWTISTSPSRDPECVKQKVQWLKKHIDPHFGRYMIGSQKHLMANRETVLIDDYDKNIDKFRKAGGHGILFPAIWNSMHGQAEPFRYVQRKLEGLAGVTV